jgi:integrase/recombinase XerD
MAKAARNCSLFLFPLARDKKLRRLAKELGIESNLTSYMSRHPFAKQAMLHQIPLNAISSMLGHSNMKTTEIYLKSLPSSVLDDYNERVLRNFAQ